jgi:hypothetical protein
VLSTPGVRHEFVSVDRAECVGFVYGNSTRTSSHRLNTSSRGGATRRRSVCAAGLGDGQSNHRMPVRAISVISSREHASTSQTCRTQSAVGARRRLPLASAPTESSGSLTGGGRTERNYRTTTPNHGRPPGRSRSERHRCSCQVPHRGAATEGVWWGRYAPGWRG